MKVVLEIDDLSTAEVDGILRRATNHTLTRWSVPVLANRTVALLFLSPSLRTRTGFAIAATRLGATSVEVNEPRFDAAMSAGESFEDTLRTISGITDIVVARVPLAIDGETVTRHSRAPYVSGGHTGHHPTQALIDVFAMIRFAGPLHELRIGLCGDLTMRATRSLLQLLARRPPRALALIAPSQRSDHGIELGHELSARTALRPPDDVSDLDVLVMCGLPPGSAGTRLDEPARAAFALTEERLRALDRSAVVLSPLPVIDEVAPEARRDPRVRMFDQSDLGIAVRMAVLEHLVGET